ncbi:MAG: hypothetical protein ACOX0F_01585 [Syntrophomonadaceae bacterium]|jgi:predicted membrane channel-forming protein YqfA (hemolysin III family)
MFVALFFMLVIVLLALDLPSLWRQGFNKDLVIYALFWLAALYLAMVQFYHWPFFNPLLTIARQLQGP